MSPSEITGIIIILIGALCFMFCLVRFGYFSGQLGKTLVKIGWDEKSIDTPSNVFLLLFPLGMVGLGVWLFTTDYKDQISKLEKQVAGIKVKEETIWRVVEELKRVDQVYHLTFPGQPPEGFDPADIRLEASVKKKGGHEFRLYEDKPRVEIVPSGLVATIPSLNPGDQLFIVMKMNDGQEWKTQTLQVPATPAPLQRVSRSR